MGSGKRTGRAGAVPTSPWSCCADRVPSPPRYPYDLPVVRHLTTLPFHRR